MDKLQSIKDSGKTDKEIKERRDSDASLTSEELPQSIRVRRNSLIDQFRDFLSRSVDFSFEIDDPFEKEMY